MIKMTMFIVIMIINKNPQMIKTINQISSVVD